MMTNFMPVPKLVQISWKTDLFFMNSIQYFSSFSVLCLMDNFFFNNLGPPAIELKEFMEVEEGTDVNIVAKIKGVPFPTLTWL